jgi:hypothetical protein
VNSGPPAVALDRQQGLDALRGALLLAMLAVHVVSGHGAAPEVNALHEWVGVFLISSGFVGLSGFVAGARPGGLTAPAVGRALETALQLIAVMLAYALFASAVRYGLDRLAGGAVACAAARQAWGPPVRFGSFGILLPIALLQLFAPWARASSRWMAASLGVFAVGWMLLPALTEGVRPEGPLGAVVGALTRRTLTPYYVITTFVAVGLCAAVMGRFSPRWLVRPPRAKLERVGLLAAAAVLGSPLVSNPLLKQAYLGGGTIVGGLVTLVSWLVPLALILRASAFTGDLPVWARPLALLGRHSLWVFVLHEFLLELNGFARTASGVDKGVWAWTPMFGVDAVALWAAARWLDSSARAKRAAVALWLARPSSASLLRSGAAGVMGLFALTLVLASYSSHALSGPKTEQVIDDFERGPECPRWWTFGEVDISRTPEPAGSHLALRGEAPRRSGHGMGVFLNADMSGYTALALKVRGYGPESGQLKIELFEDDNGNWEIEKDPRSYLPVRDDRFVREIVVDWIGWRDVILPLSSFRDDNPAGGNGVFDPARDLASGGLLEVQVVVKPSTSLHERVQIDLDDVRWTR